MATYISKEVDVDIEIGLSDVLEFISECKDKELEKIREAAEGEGYDGIKYNSLTDSYRMDLCMKLYKNLNEKEIEEIIKKYNIH